MFHIQWYKHYTLGSFHMCHLLTDFFYWRSTIKSRWDSSVSIVTRLWVGRPGFGSRQGQGYFLFSTASSPVLRPTQHPVQWVPGSPSLQVKRPEGEADYSPPSSAKIKIACSYTCTPPIRLHGVVLN